VALADDLLADLADQTVANALELLETLIEVLVRHRPSRT